MQNGIIRSSSSASGRALARPGPGALANWLMAVAALVLLMVVVGGITRLTESGLSITRWEPVTGAVPPLNEADWQHAFDLYKGTTEYQTVNRGMTLGDFKFIFFWEYIHRLLGRVIGLAFAAPLLWFAVRGAIPRGYGARLVALLALGALQGTIGWWMVRSGLVNRVDVSHIRLAVHLLTALFILGGLVWTARDLRALARDPGARTARLTGFALLVMAALAVQLLLGAFTAGLRAGHAFSTWPLMGDSLFPAGVPMLNPAWANLVDNPIVVQFVHRWWAWLVAGLIVVLAWRVRPRRAGLALTLAALVATQIALGIATLMSGVALWIAVAHQGVGALLVAAAASGAHALGTRGR
jgi:cytochrome c oxidase assembly protein subunit 15